MYGRRGLAGTILVHKVLHCCYYLLDFRFCFYASWIRDDYYCVTLPELWTPWKILRNWYTTRSFKPFLISLTSLYLVFVYTNQGCLFKLAASLLNEEITIADIISIIILTGQVTPDISSLNSKIYLMEVELSFFLFELRKSVVVW